jgi:anti-sigma factor RsiW
VSTLTRLSSHDLETLSAYVDGALPPREQADLAARLERDQVLKQSLTELRALKAAMASLPERRVPRNFTLREADVVRRKAGLLFSTLRFATVVASVLFVLTTAVRALPMQLALGASAPQMEMSAEVQAVAEEPMAPTEVGDELRAEAPAAAAGEMADSSAPAGTPTPAATVCPECPALTEEGKAGVAQEGGERFAVAAARTPALNPLATAQWLLGAAAVVLGILSVRARRR